MFPQTHPVSRTMYMNYVCRLLAVCLEWEVYTTVHNNIIIDTIYIIGCNIVGL